MTPRTLAELLELRATREPSLPVYTFLQDGELTASRLTTEGLALRARAIAARLAGDGVMPGSRALLAYPPGLDFIAGLFGCFYAGVVAVPIYHPHPARLDRDLPRVLRIVNDASPSAILIDASLEPLRTKLSGRGELSGIRWIATDRIEAGEAGPDPCVSGSLAMLQYTSGSTSEPKGVELSHANLLANSECIHRAMETSSSTVGVIWLPPYHDMGLIGGILQPLYTGFPVVLMSPMHFLQRPIRWLEAITRHRGTLSGGPNFAYELALSRAPKERVEALDLGSWDVAFTGAEPIRAETIDRFEQTFAPKGFRRRAFFACYGLAEGTLMATAAKKGEGPRVLELSAEALAANRVEPGDGKKVVSCGRPAHQVSAAIVDPSTNEPAAAGAIGEVWLAGPSTAAGYWKREDATEATFRALIPGRGPHLRTGDLGFFHDGELFITGRQKGLIIIAGANHYPQDIELSVEQCHEAIRRNGVAAFSVDRSGQEELVVIAEIDPKWRRRDGDLPPVVKSIRRAIAEEHQLEAQVVLVEAGTVPLTSSGKIQRNACRATFLSGGYASARV
jgi:acyl-CoA synthetase (AMP-forming)/AMP-acid ligase II